MLSPFCLRWMNASLSAFGVVNETSTS